MKRIFMILIAIFCVMLFTVSYADDGSNNKKVVSIVYDDSGSMTSYNNYCYSDYALQILTASLGSNDELNIVKVSTPYQNNEIDLSTYQKKQSYIDIIRAYSHVGGTYFQSVDTAKNWLISKKNVYKENADYWFVVITDGEFAEMPDDLNSYFTQLNQEFNNQNYEFVLLNIGASFDRQFEDAVNNSANSSVIKANDKDSIYTSILHIANLINRGASAKIIQIIQATPTKLTIQADLPLEKMIVLMQNSEGTILNVKNLSTGKNLTVENYNVKYNEISDLSASVAQVTDSNSGSINRGMYEITFSGNVDTNKISFLCEAFVSAKISIVDENDKVLNDSKMKFLTVNKRIRVKCELLDGTGTTKIDLSNTGVDFSNINIQLVNDKNKYNMTYDPDKMAYYTELTLIGKSNNIYAIAEAKDVFRVKSNVVFIDTEVNQMNVDNFDSEKIVFEVPYSADKEYNLVNTFVFNFIDDNNEYNIAENFEIKLIDLPNGVCAEYEGKDYFNNDSIPMIKEVNKEYQLKFKSNKDYKETDDYITTIKIITKQENSDIFWSANGVDEMQITFRPKMYRIDVVKKSIEEKIDVKNDTLKLSLIRIDEQSNTVLGTIDMNDVGKIDTNSNFGSGFTYKVKKNDNSNTLELEFKPNILAIFKSHKLPIELSIELANGKERTQYSDVVELTNIDVLGLLMPYIIALILFIIVLGYFVKKKFNKKSRIAITENGDRVLYALRPQMATLLIPYKTQKCKIGMIEFKAGKGNDIVYSAKGLEIVKIDGEDFEEYKEANRINLDKMVMKRDFSNIIINAYEVEQKYEYVSNEPDVASYSGDSNDSNDYYSDGDADSYDSSYSDDNLY